MRPWKAPAAQEAVAAGAGAGKLDGGFDAFAARAAEEHFGEASAGEAREAIGQLAGELGDVALQHGGAAAVEFILERFDDSGVVVAGVVDAIAGEEVEDAAAVGGKELGGGAAFRLHVHLQDLEQADPLRVHAIGVFGRLQG